MFKFNIKSKVKIDELNRQGIVVGIYASETGTQYQVRYFYEGDAKTVYFYEHEIHKVEDN